MHTLFAPERSKYVGTHITGCVFCAIRDGEDVFTRLIYKDKRIIVLMNIFPYSPGHLQVLPTRHVVELEQLSDEDLCVLLDFTGRSLRLAKKTMQPQGFNIGINLGEGGASIKHLHIQIVPRYKQIPSLSQLDIHKLYLTNLKVLGEKIPSREAERCTCPPPQYLLKNKPLVYLCKKPYNRAHVIISPKQHRGFEQISPTKLLDLFKEVIKVKKAIEKVYKPIGMNIGINLGDVPNSAEHLQIHLVPRYKLESGFMEVVGDTRVVVESLENTYQRLKHVY